MKIAVIGTGYVGLVTGVCLAELGHHVTCIDVDQEKVEKLNSGKSPIYEEGLEELLQKNLHNEQVEFTTEYQQGLKDKQLVYLAVGTPQGEDGSADLTYIEAASRDIAEHLENDTVIVTKSTVPVGTNEYIKEIIEANLVHEVHIKIASNPEFLRQGSAVYDTFHGDRIVIGSDDEEALELLEAVNAGFNLPIVKTDLRSAEMIKYASNAFLATKISFINEMANLSEKIGANIDHVARGMGMDKRIGESFLNAGIGFGGSCFPKDTRAIISIGKEIAYDMPILENVVDVNERQRSIIVDKLLKRVYDLKGKKVAVLGLSFKPNTDDMREAPSIAVTEKLLEEGATVVAYDPVAVANAKKVLPGQVNYAESAEEAVQGADVAIILTEWKQIKEFPLTGYKERMNKALLFDGRNCFNLDQVKDSGVEYHSIGRPVIYG
ncbi:UDP-glucose 6-dehydrogenase YwqF [Thalassobacillus devorans]|uniref:UDP-glucose 6-dehydrogenase n=1 Tax=Thalassobacillus devorans TaxID=279813 RepID=A0ABQ1NV29_9BACI|nr:UDP-glucose/GDP-mannose dehydrogenase family protein [Thalassobacillus devorans]NIK28528.1 UDPglucose 6-dehydrogenase [Thalassobacillus devorans]GGC85511.1 UDP-glucose 6-dehydrogenase YwqF [Thalassobacillus devorans]